MTTSLSISIPVKSCISTPSQPWSWELLQSQLLRRAQVGDSPSIWKALAHSRLPAASNAIQRANAVVLAVRTPAPALLPTPAKLDDRSLLTTLPFDDEDDFIDSTYTGALVKRKKAKKVKLPKTTEYTTSTYTTTDINGRVFATTTVIPKKKKKLSKKAGVIAGIVIGAIVGAILLAVVVFYLIAFLKKRKQRSLRDSDIVAGEPYTPVTAEKTPETRPVSTV